MNQRTQTGVRRGRRRGGSALSMALACSLTVAAVGVSMATVSAANYRDNEASRVRAERKLVAHAGLAASFADLVANGTGNLGTTASPVRFGHGNYVVTAVRNADGTITLTSTGRVGTGARTLRAVLRENTRNPFYSAIYAGNSSGDPTYTLSLGGTGQAADAIEGDLYSGGNIKITGDATVTGGLHAVGTITGGTGETGIAEPAPDLIGAHYEAVHDVNVAEAFRARGTYLLNDLGGSAYQLPEEDPAHIFRMNPSDRRAEFTGTLKDDFFLEDPYENVSASSVTNASNATKITLSGIGGEPGTSGTGKVYFIDGNLWVHNKKIYSFALSHNEAAGVQVTFVVKGNIYISDNILLKNKVKDGVALIAVKDPSVPDSGNIYFGDATYGTLEEMDAFMYAEGNFYDNNLGTSGSSTITVTGMMSAGNQVAINHGTGANRTKLVLDFDTRVRDGTLTLPGLPQTQFSSGRKTFTWLAEYEVAGGA